jgi:L-asparaginase
MAYTASALAFLLRGLDRPVVVTGSQIPLGVLRSDGRQNLLTAVLVAARADVREVCLVFGSQILRGCRAIKASASGFEAFESPNLPALGAAGVEIEIDAARLRPPMPGPIGLPPNLDAPVNMLRLYPGMPAALLRAALARPARGLVLEAYGAGNLPDTDSEMLETLAEGARRGVAVLVVSQCVDGRVDLGAYATSGPLVAAGAVGGLDMTTEAAYAKLVVLLSEGHPPDEVRALLARDLTGELTV